MLNFRINRIPGMIRVGIIVAVYGLGFTSFLAAVVNIQNPKPVEIEVQVLFDGKPVEGAKVWLEGLSEDRCDIKVQSRIEPVTTPKSGSFRRTLFPGIDSYQIFAKKDNDLSGLCSFQVEWKKQKEGIHRVLLNLAKIKPIQGRLFLDQKPASGIECKVCLVRRNGKSESQTIVDNAAIRPRTDNTEFPVSVKTDTEGNFSLGGYPLDCSMDLRVLDPILGTGVFEVFPDKFDEFELMRGGHLALSVEGEKVPHPLRGFKVWTMDPPREANSPARKMVALVPEPTIFHDHFTAPGKGGLSIGNYELFLPVDPEISYHFGPSQMVKIESGKTTTVILRKFPLAFCSGRILDAKTGKGISNLSFQLKGTKKWDEENPRSKEFTDIIRGKTDPDGKYSIPCKGNHVYTLEFDPNEMDYEPPLWNVSNKRWSPPVPHKFIGEKEKATFPDISIQRSRVLEGFIQNGDGKPVDGPLTIYSATKGAIGEVDYRLEKGKLTLTKLTPNLPLIVYLRKGNEVNVPEEIPLDKLDRPISFAISEKNQVTAKGVIVGPNRKPISGATVQIIWMPPYPRDPFSLGSFEQLDLIPGATTVSDDQGRFSIQGLWPGAGYYLCVEAEGYQKSYSFNGFKIINKKEGPGKTINFGILELKKESP